MPLNYISSTTQAAERIHVVRDSDATVIGVNLTFSPDELQEVIRAVNGAGNLDGAWYVIEKGRRELNRANDGRHRIERF